MNKKSKRKQEAIEQERKWQEEEFTPEELAGLRYFWHLSRFDSGRSARLIVKLCNHLAKCKNWNLDEVEWEDNHGKQYKGMEEIIIPEVKAGVGVIVIRDFDGVKKVLTGIRQGSHGEGRRAFPGGHIDGPDGDLDATSQREVLEETGMVTECRKIRGGWDLLTTYDILSENGKKKYVTTYVVADWVSGEAQRKEPDKCEKWEWTTLDRLGALVKNDGDQVWIPIDRIMSQREELKL